MLILTFKKLSKMRMSLKFFVEEVGKISIVGISESWLTADDKTSLWKAVPNTHELTRCDVNEIISKKKGLV